MTISISQMRSIETYAKSKELAARLETATGGTGAELAAQQAKNAEAEMLASAREWAIYRFGQILLSRAIEEHRTQNQNPLMRQAGELFQARRTSSLNPRGTSPRWTTRPRPGSPPSCARSRAEVAPSAG